MAMAILATCTSASALVYPVSRKGALGDLSPPMGSSLELLCAKPNQAARVRLNGAAGSLQRTRTVRAVCGRCGGNVSIWFEQTRWLEAQLAWVPLTAVMDNARRRLGCWSVDFFIGVQQ